MISNALPIQFWAEGQETFNEEEVCSIFQVCYCQPVNCDDPANPIQFIHPTGQVVKFLAIDEDDIILVFATMTESASGVYEYYLDYDDLCDTIVRTYIVTDQSAVNLTLFSNSDFSAALTGWAPIVSDPPTFEPWVDGPGNTAQCVISGSPLLSEQLKHTDIAATGAASIVEISAAIGIDIVTGETITGYVKYSVHGPSGTGVQNEIEELQKIVRIDFTSTGPENFLGSIQYLVNEVPITSISIQVVVESITSGDVNIKLYIFGASEYSDYGFTEKSDCLDIRGSHDCTKLITYSNNNNFAGLVYNGSPPAEFSLRVPAVMFHQQFPEEEQAHALSNDEFIRVWGRLEKKYQLDIGFIPYYFHEKLKLIFMHDNVSIDGIEVVKRDNYEIVEGNKRYPLKKATVLLTDKNFIKRNLI